MGYRGSVLVYLIVVILIFGILGVTMVSLFTTATTSSATPNDARRAFSMAESGARYAMGELRRNVFADDTLKTLNETIYKIDQTKSFEFNIYSIALRSTPSPPEQNNPIITLNKLKSDIGEIPDDFNLPPNRNIYAINMDPSPNSSGIVYYPAESDNSTAKIQIFEKNGANSYRITVADSFTVNNGVIVSLAVKPLPNQSPSAGGSLDVEPDAQFFFPERNGAVVIRDKALFYERAIYHNSGPERVELTKLSDAVTIPTNIDNYFTIMAPENYVILPTGASDGVSYGNDINYTVNVYDQRIRNPVDGTYVPQLERKSDIEPDEFNDNINPVATTPTIITPIPDDNALDIGGSPPPGPDADFGAGWYSGNQSIGGNPDVCTTGRCIFGLGARVFFTFNYTGDGDGFTFTMMNADPTDGNDITSIGGDPQGSELLAYAGDSRVDPAGTVFLDNNRGRGIVPPKLAVEFDAKTNFDQNFEDEAIKNYCSGPNLRQDTRNDPLPDGAAKDAVQFVYWADRNPIDIPCRPNGDPVFSTSSYDDNRHAPSAAPINERDLFLTDSELDVTPSNDWLNDGPWAVRLEVERSLVQNLDGNYDYKLRLWMRQCTQADCNDILGTFFQDTRIEYDYSALPPDLPLDQDIELSPSDHAMFNRFLFGFTTATAPGDTQSALIEHFNLSFIRPNDPVITDDPAWPPPP